MTAAVDTNQTLRELSELIRTHDSNVAKADAKVSADNDRFEAEIQQRLAAINPEGDKGALKFALSLVEWTALALIGCQLIFSAMGLVFLFIPFTETRAQTLAVEPRHISLVIVYLSIIWAAISSGYIFYKNSLLRIRRGVGKKSDVERVLEYERTVAGKWTIEVLPFVAFVCSVLVHVVFIR